VRDPNVAGSTVSYPLAVRREPDPAVEELLSRSSPIATDTVELVPPAEAAALPVSTCGRAFLELLDP
jgi:hypothetical protein